MNDYTQRTIESLKHMHRVRAGTLTFATGGAAADAALVRAMEHLEAHPLNDGDFGGPANAALSIATRF